MMDTLGAILRQSAFGLEPFDPKKHRPQDIGLGGPSTEYLATEYDQNGQPMNIPQIWWDKAGNPHHLSPDAAIGMAREYETATGQRFPRFDTIGAGAERAMHRSAQGGAQKARIVEALTRWSGR